MKRLKSIRTSTLLLASFLLFPALPAFSAAPPSAPTPSVFAQIVSAIQSVCKPAQNICLAPLKVDTIWRSEIPDGIQTTTIMPREALAFTRISDNQSQIWGDTILESDYEADGVTLLEQVQTISKNGKIVAYRITYSQRAWQTTTCKDPNFNPANPVGCIEGRIRESTYVSSDLTVWLNDSQFYAQFKRL
jgi:hypothetical protein